MNAAKALDIIRAMEATGVKIEKESLLTELAGSDLGTFILKATYDPFVTYGLTPPRQEGEGNLEFRQALVTPLLRRLALRELTGNAAAREVAEVMTALDRDGAELLWRILSKDLKCGVGESTVNRVVPGLLPVFSVMRAHKYETKRIKSWPVAVEPKLDGFRVSFVVRDGNGGFFARSGKRLPALDHMVTPVMQVAAAAMVKSKNKALRDLLSNGAWNFMLDGEMMAGEFNETSGALRRKSEKAQDAQFHIFDIMSFAEFDATGSHAKPYSDRRALVEEFVSYATPEHVADLAPGQVTKTPRYFAHSDEEVQDYFARFLARGLEGAMVKIPTGGYDKKKSYGWLKLKAEDTEDLRIVGAFPGEKYTKYEDSLGGLIVVREHNGALVEVRVGGGFSDAQRTALWEAFVRDSEAEHWPSPGANPELIGRLVEVEFHEVTPDGSLRHPRFKRFRDDKDGEVESKEIAA